MKSHRRRWLLLTGALVLTLVHGCSGGCGGNKAPLSFIPKDALVVLVMPSVSKTLGQVRGLNEKFKKGLLSGALISQHRTMLQQELGFDPEKPETMKRVGLDPERGLAACLIGPEEVALAVGVTDADAVDKYLKMQLGKALRGTTKYTNKTASGAKLTVVSIDGQPERIAWAHVKKTLVLGGSAQGKATSLVARLVGLDKSIEENAAFKKAADKLGPYDAMLFVDGAAAKKAVAARTKAALETASDWMKSFIRERQQTSDAVLTHVRGMALALRLQGEELTVAGYLGVPPGKGKPLKQIFSGVGDALPFGKYISDDALIVARASLNGKAALDKSLELLPSRRKRRIYRKLERMERENSINLEKDVLGSLAGRFALALYPGSLSGTPRSASAIAQAVPLVVMAQVQNAKRVTELLERLERHLVARGAEINIRSEGNLKIFTLVRDGSAVVSWTVTKNVLLLATGKRLEKTLALIKNGGKNIYAQLKSKAAKQALKLDDGVVINADLVKINDLVRNLDLGMELKVMLMPAFNALSKFKDITATLEVQSEGMLGSLTIMMND